jgi:hypothetical protein
MKKFRFKKGIYTTHLPFMLHDLSPWQEQVKEERRKFLTRYQLAKRHRLDFEITGLGAMLTVTRF